MKRINNLFLLSFVGLNLLSCSTNSNMNINKPSIEEEIISSSIEDEIIDETLSEQVSDFIGKDEEITESEQIKEEDNSQVEVGKEEKYYYFEEKIKIYINPSVQYKNLYANDLGNEGEHMREISIILTDMLIDYTNLVVYANNSYPGLSLSQSVKESNDYDVDYHIALHSNAGGGKGSEGWHSYSSKKLTNSILTKLDEILPYKTRGLKDGSKSLYEIKNTNSCATLIEVLFHDDYMQAKFITTNYYKIAKAIFDGIVSYLD